MKAIIPAAGLGTRLLPLTKSVPKELLPVGSRPALQWVLEEVHQAGIEEIVVVTSPRKPALKHFLTKAVHDERVVDSKGVAALEELLKALRITFVEQPELLGLRDAVGRCAPIVGSDPFAVVLPDNVTMKPDLLRQLLEVHSITGQSCLAVYPLAGSLRRLESSAYVVVVDGGKEGIASVCKVVPAVASSSHQSWRVGIGRYVFTRGVMDLFGPHECSGDGPDEENEVLVLNVLASRGALLGVENESEIWHVGSIDEYLAAFHGLAKNKWLDSSGDSRACLKTQEDTRCQV